jgi:hypothetical protein
MAIVLVLSPVLWIVVASFQGESSGLTRTLEFLGISCVLYLGYLLFFGRFEPSRSRRSEGRDVGRQF